jgi:hypothetical protein
MVEMPLLQSIPHVKARKPMISEELLDKLTDPYIERTHLFQARQALEKTPQHSLRTLMAATADQANGQGVLAAINEAVSHWSRVE